MESIVAFLHIYLCVQLVSALSLPLSQSIFSRLPDRGYCLNKAAGILALGLVLWLGNAFGLLLNDAGGAWLAVATVAVLALAAGRSPAGCLTWWGRQARFVLIAESLFLLAFAAWATVRFFDPAIYHTEQPMDFMLLNALHTQALFPPQDPWLSGYSIGYYYLGYWLMNAVGRLAGVAPDLGYNLLQSLWFGLLVLGSFGLGYNICRLGGAPGRTGRNRGLAGGLLAAVSVAVVGNLHLVRALVAGEDGLAGVLDSDAWWRASRLFTDWNPSEASAEIITEFPSFSYVIGNNHAHVLAAPLLLLVCGLALDLLRGGARSGALGIGRARLIAAGVTSGAFLAVNTWDYPLAMALLVAGFVVHTWRLPARGALRLVAFAIALPAIAAIVYLPHLITAQSQAGGIGLSIEHLTPLESGAVMFGAFLPGALALFLLAWRRFAGGLRALVFGAAGLAFAALFVFVTRGSGAVAGLPETLAAPASLGVGLAAGVLVSGLGGGQRSRRDDGLLFSTVLLTAGTALVVVPEVAYVHDTFQSRMNTVFKFWYQAWPLLALASTSGIVLAWRRTVGGSLLAVAGLLVLALALPYPGIALASKSWGDHLAEQRSALGQVRIVAPDEAAAIAWVQRNLPADAVVLQGAGDSYRPEHNRISTYTARPTLLGWRGHEVQWRGAAYNRMTAGREAALNTIFRSGSQERIVAVLDEWVVDYVYLGPAERSQYSVTSERERELRTLLDPVFDRGNVTIFRATGEVSR